MTRGEARLECLRLASTIGPRGDNVDNTLALALRLYLWVVNDPSDPALTFETPLEEFVLEDGSDLLEVVGDREPTEGDQAAREAIANAERAAEVPRGSPLAKPKGKK